MPDFKGFLRSTAIFVWHTVRHWLTWISAGLASFASWATYVYTIPAPAPRYSYMAAAALLVIAFCWTFHLTRVERDKLLDERAPKLEIVFDPKNDEDSRPYLQTLHFRQYEDSSSPGYIPMVDRRHPVRGRHLRSPRL